MKLTYLIFFMLSLCVRSATSLPTSQFDRFFPGWNDRIQEIVHGPCQGKYNDYKVGKIEEGLDVGQGHIVYPLIHCILDKFPEFRKAELASSAVLMGTMPTILQGLGSSTAELVVLGLRRPFLAFLLAAGNPAMQAQKVGDLSGLLSAQVPSSRAWEIPRRRWMRIPAVIRPLCSLLEYVFVGLAVANVVHLAYELGVHAVVVFAPSTIFLVPLWSFFALAFYCLGFLVRRPLARFSPPDSGRTATVSSADNSGFPSWTPQELLPVVLQTPKEIGWRCSGSVFVDSLSLVAEVASLSSTSRLASVFHVVFGTLLFSSLLFFSVVDALTVVARYCASGIACHIVLKLELDGLRPPPKYKNAKVGEGPDQEDTATRYRLSKTKV